MSVCLTIDCDEPWFSLLEKGIKPVEGRKGKTKYRSLKPGDMVRFQCTEGNRSFFAKVERIDSFNTVLEYLEKVTLEKALPGITTLNEGLSIYSEWSSFEEIENLGFVGIWIKLDPIFQKNKF